MSLVHITLSNIITSSHLIFDTSLINNYLYALHVIYVKQYMSTYRKVKDEI